MIELETSEVNRRFRRLATAAAFSSLFTYAVVMTATPASINEIGRFYKVSTSQLGGLFRLLMLGFLGAAVAGGRYSDRRGKLPLLAVGSLMMIAGTCLFAWTSSFTVAGIAMFLMGIGGEFAEGLGVAMVSDLYEAVRRTAMLNWTQVFFSLGAIISPVGIGILLDAGLSWRIGLLGAAVLCVLSCLITLMAVATGNERPLASHHGHDGDWRKVTRDPLVIWLCTGIMLYVGAELGLANWLAAYFEMSLHTSAPLAASSGAVFWIGIGAGRVTATWASKRVSDMSIICSSLALGLLLMVAILLLGSPTIVLVAVFGFGFCMGPVWPTIVSRAGAAHPMQSGTVLGMVVAAGCTGGAIFPPAIGWLADLTTMHTALWMCSILQIANLAIFLRLWRRG